MTAPRLPPIVPREPMLRPLINWLTASNFAGGGRASAEVVFLRLFGLAYLVVVVVSTFETHPRPALHGDGLVVLIALAVFIASAVATQPRNDRLATRTRIALLLCVLAGGAVLAAGQPGGIWPAGAYFIGIVAAMRLERTQAVLVLSVSLATLVAIAFAEGRRGAALSLLIGAVPWFLVMRMVREMRLQHQALEASQAAEARAAADVERGRLAREMHDVLAHSLSALALQLESTRLLARDRATDSDVVRALDEAHHLAAGGLDEARRAIGAARGEELPGPERLPALVEAFEQQSGIAAALAVNGTPRELASDEQLAVYRTAQEALTNIRRHTMAERVEVRLDYLPDATVLVVEDRAVAGSLPPAITESGGGYGLTGLRERAELLGGSLTARATEHGFRLELRVPADAPAPREPSRSRAASR